MAGAVAAGRRRRGASSSTPSPAPSRPGARGRRLSFDRVSLMVVFLGLPFAFYVVMVLYPFTQATYYSVTAWTGFSPEQPFVGLDNYVRLAGDAQFLNSLGNSLTLLVVVPAVTLVLSFALACVLTFGGSTAGAVRGLRGTAFYRVVSFFPYVVPAIVIGIIWSQVYNPSNGLLNGLLVGVGLDGFTDFAWLGQASTAMAATIAVIVWAFVGFYMVLFVAAIQNIDPELFEAARLDGAGRVRTALSIALPGIAGSVRTAYVYMGILALDAFVYMQALNPTGGPESSTLVVTQQVFTTAFAQGQFGIACAMGVVLAVVTLVFVGLVFGVARLLGVRGGARA
ncbi:carbohydrate ABC transporter permease [Pseudokineococcus lusitanus]|uniref:Carbohydrate ABC transporter membrane protein 1 (CUT1 family) n=1 Tax=Pseudokineococcus lusitanus TaxID=763993 RepID=A0A3N1GWL5_9ACTN|nr:sugar ABC transporter permease [Pseudokineococcus lusitanus]ROP34526.1 carbohydrate ABC transporter membrane protein 1 (CUT1 family) [Pseudokineococcus lusitanus]